LWGQKSTVKAEKLSMSTPGDIRSLTTPCLRKFASTLGLAVVLLSAVAMNQSSQASTFRVLHEFTGQLDGQWPESGLVRDPGGNFYGTTYAGGSGNCNVDGVRGCGTVFKIDRGGKETILYSFAGGSDGAYPLGSLIRDAEGNLYGTTSGGGDVACSAGNGQGSGTVFEIEKDGKETVLYSFTGNPDGAFPTARLTQDASGSFYSTTYGGGSGLGTVFKLNKAGTETVLYSFPGFSEGGQPLSDVILDKLGNIYGTASNYGGINQGGVAFKIGADGTYSVLHAFNWEWDGGDVVAGLLLDRGDLYGTTASGGRFGKGVLFRLNAKNHETIAHAFAGPPFDGYAPSADVIPDSAGNLFGTTSYGGTSKECGNAGCGTIFGLDIKRRRETVLHSFNGKNGAIPQKTALVRDRKGNLFGCTEQGGSSGYGTVFVLTP
jgi:uncharacterized repeat protein (TIGR03803 family)